MRKIKEYNQADYVIYLTNKNIYILEVRWEKTNQKEQSLLIMSCDKGE